MLTMQNVAGSKVTQYRSEGTAGCNCDRWGHPFPDRFEHNVKLENLYDTKTHTSRTV